MEIVFLSIVGILVLLAVVFLFTYNAYSDDYKRPDPPTRPRTNMEELEDVSPPIVEKESKDSDKVEDEIIKFNNIDNNKDRHLSLREILDTINKYLDTQNLFGRWYRDYYNFTEQKLNDNILILTNEGELYVKYDDFILLRYYINTYEKYPVDLLWHKYLPKCARDTVYKTLKNFAIHLLEVNLREEQEKEIEKKRLEQEKKEKFLDIVKELCD